MTQQRQDLRLAILKELNRCLRNGQPPTVWELGAAVGGYKPANIQYYLDDLAEEGLITRTGKSRGIRLTQVGQQLLRVGNRVPIDGAIAAGYGLEAFEEKNPEEWFELVPHDERTVHLRVKGDSMIDEHISEGDVVLVRRTSSFVDGALVVAWLKDGPSEAGELTLKRAYREKRQSNGKGMIRLVPSNQAMQPRLVAEDEVEIQGCVVGLIRQIAM